MGNRSQKYLVFITWVQDAYPVKDRHILMKLQDSILHILKNMTKLPHLAKVGTYKFPLLLE